MSEPPTLSVNEKLSAETLPFSIVNTPPASDSAVPDSLSPSTLKLNVAVSVLPSGIVRTPVHFPFRSAKKAVKKIKQQVKRAGANRFFFICYVFVHRMYDTPVIVL